MLPMSSSAALGELVNQPGGTPIVYPREVPNQRHPSGSEAAPADGLGEGVVAAIADGVAIGRSPEPVRCPPGATVLLQAISPTADATTRRFDRTTLLRRAHHRTQTTVTVTTSIRSGCRSFRLQSVRTRSARISATLSTETCHPPRIETVSFRRSHWVSRSLDMPERVTSGSTCSRPCSTILTARCPQNLCACSGESTNSS